MSSPEDALRAYWKASYSGQGKQISQLSDFAPPNMLKPCAGTFRSADDDRFELKLSDVTNLDPPSESLEDPFSKITAPSDVKAFSKYIFYSRIDYGAVKIDGNREYGDEAELTARVAGPYETTSAIAKHDMVFFLMRVDGNWKLVGIASKELLLKILPNYDFAAPDHHCN